MLAQTESEVSDAVAQALRVTRACCAQLGLAAFAAERISPPAAGAVGLSELAAALAPR